MLIGELVRFFSSIQSPVGAVELLIASLMTIASGLIPGSATPGPPPLKLLGRQFPLMLSGFCVAGGTIVCAAAGSRTTRLYPPPLAMAYQSSS
jgi:hypothetical protein